MDEREELEKSLHYFEAQRAILGDVVTDAALEGVRQRLLHWHAQQGEQRKQVTILFADLVGFTALASQWDPEEMRSILEGYFQRVRAPVLHFGGYIEKYIGDAVMAVFGIPLAGEQDTECAILAALAMQATLTAYNRQLADRYRVQLQLRVGINTGWVIAGALGGRPDHDISVVGDAVNVASRLEKLAPPGGVLISQESYRHVQGLFEVQPLDPLVLRGKSEPMTVYLVQGARSPLASSVASRELQSPMLGRETEFAQLQQGFHRVVDQQRSHLMLVVGEAGVGKSRLVHEFASWLEQLPRPVRLLKGQAMASTSQLPYTLLHSLLTYYFGIQGSDSFALAQEKLLRGFREMLGDRAGEEAAHFIGQLIGLAFEASPHLTRWRAQGRTLQTGVLEQLMAVLQSLARHAPLVLFLEDLHWADHASLELFGHLFRRCTTLPFMVVGTIRAPFQSQLSHAWPLKEGDSQHEWLHLNQLAAEPGLCLVRALLQRLFPNPPPEVVQQLVATAGGNPFYLEELIKMLVEKGELLGGVGRWSVLGGQGRGQVPHSLVEVLQARLERLTPLERQLLQRAAVVGVTFWDALLGDLMDHASLAEVETALQRLCERELIYEEARSSFEGMKEYAFKHALLQEVTYQSTLRRERRLYHAQVAHWMVAQNGGRVGERVGTIATHFEMAGEQAQALTYLGQAGQQALQIGVFRAAQHFFERAMALLQPEVLPLTQEQEWRAFLSQQLGETHFWQGHIEQAHHYLQVGLTLAEERGATHSAVTTLCLLGRVIIEMGEYEKAEQLITTCLARAYELDDQSCLVDSMRNLGNLAFSRGKYEQTRHHYERSLALAKEIHYQIAATKALSNLARLDIDLGHYERAQGYLEEGLALAHALGNQFMLAYLIGDQGQVAYYLGEYSLAWGHYKRSMALRQEIGDQEGVAKVSVFCGDWALAQGYHRSAEGFYEESLAIRQQMDYRLGIGTSLAKLGLLACAQGDFALAEQRLGEALTVSLAVGAWPKALLALSYLAHLRYQQWDYEAVARLLGYLLHHPASDVCEVREPIAALGMRLVAHLPMRELDALLAEGQRCEATDFMGISARQEAVT